MKQLTASALRANVYNILDTALETGNSIIIVRKGKKLKIVPVKTETRLQKIKKYAPKHSIVKGNSENLVHLDWSKEWKL